MYEDIARTNLTSTRWRFATNQAILNRLSDAPTGRFTAAYQLPEYIFLHAVTVRDYQIEYNVYGNKVFCDADVSDELIADYTYRQKRSIGLHIFLFVLNTQWQLYSLLL